MKHQISWVSIPTSDFERAVKFYSAVTGKEFKAQGEGDERMATSLSEEEMKDEIVGFGISGDSKITPGTQGPRIYIYTNDLDGYMSRVEEVGGKILHPKDSMGEYGFWALIEDSEGNHIGLHSR
jgi:predicted enzyme related to lactoylglutathione lyase